MHDPDSKYWSQLLCTLTMCLLWGTIDELLLLLACCRVKLVAPREYNPRYEADFSLAANYDPDRQRAAAQKLKRELTKEKRGAMRELRRDAAFMSAVSVAHRPQAAYDGVGPYYAVTLFGPWS